MCGDGRPRSALHTPLTIVIPNGRSPRGISICPRWESDMKKPYCIGLGIALGAGIGAAMASATHMGAWLPIATGIGLAIGSALSNRQAARPGASSLRAKS